MENCPICLNEIEYSSLGSRDAYIVTCPNCGIYHLTCQALANLRTTHLSDRERANMSGWLRKNSIFEITTQNIEFLTELKTPSFHDRADSLLEYLENKTRYAGEFLNQTKSWNSAGWCINNGELMEITSFLSETERIETIDSMGKVNVKIRPTGWAHLETLKKVNSNLKQAFVAMWFNDEMQPIYDDAISKAISKAGYSPHRVDQREHNEKIDDEIISQIKKSRFVLADFTGHRGGVYFEAGFAKGLGLEVIWSCREDDLENLHFDIRQYNCIIWKEEELDEFKTKITNRIEAVLGRGAYN